MRKDKQRGAIVVEATISLTAFVFAIFTILSVVNICYIQSKMGIALNSAAKEISQYSYLYYKFSLDTYDSKVAEGTQDSRLTADQTIDGVKTFVDSMSGAKNDFDDSNFSSMIDNVNNGVESADSLVTMYADKISDDPKGFIVGMGKMAANELKEEAKVYLAQALAKSFMKKNLKAFDGDDPDQFLRRYHVVDGMDGLDFNYTTFLMNGMSNEIQLVVTYDVQVIRLLNIDFKFTFRQMAKTTAWGNGISAANPSQSTPSYVECLWDEGSTTRGKKIVIEEKKNYQYTSTGYGFDAYSNANGSNEFIGIISINTHDKSYQNSSDIKNKISSAYSDMYAKVSALDETIEVKASDGTKTTINSSKDSRTYKLVVVVPENADMNAVNKAKTDFESSHPGCVVEVKSAYGSPKQNDVSTTAKAESK